MHGRRFIFPISLIATTLLIVSVSSAEEMTRDDWTFALGLGTFHGPEYEGSAKAETFVFPDFEVAWNDKVFLDLDSLSVNYYENESLILNAIVAQGDEREESLNASFSGLGDIDASTTLTLGAEFELGLFISNVMLTKHSGGTNGIQAIVGIETMLPLQLLTGNMPVANMESMEDTEEFTLTGPFFTAALTAEWADDDYINGFFGVDAMQSERSGLPQYAALAGFKSLNLELGVLHIIYNSWTVQGLAGYNTLIGDAGKSPIVKDDDFIYFAGFITYHF